MTSPGKLEEIKPDQDFYTRLHLSIFHRLFLKTTSVTSFYTLPPIFTYRIGLVTIVQFPLFFSSSYII